MRARNISGQWHHRQPGSRRVIVKQRSVRAAWKGGRARAHLRYVQRDGTSRDGERGRLYSATEDRADGAVSYTHLRAHETDSYLVCRLLLEKKKKKKNKKKTNKKKKTKRKLG